jgi:hypothetical protein
MSQFSLGSGSMEFGGDDAPLQKVASRVVRTMADTAKAMEKAAKAEFTVGGDAEVLRQAKELRDKLERLLSGIPVKAGPVEAPTLPPATPQQPTIGAGPNLSDAVNQSAQLYRQLRLLSRAMIALDLAAASVNAIIGATDIATGLWAQNMQKVLDGTDQVRDAIKSIPLIGGPIIGLAEGLIDAFTHVKRDTTQAIKDSQKIDQITERITKRAEAVGKLRAEASQLFERTIAELSRQGKTPEEVALLNVRDEIKGLEERIALFKRQNPTQPEPKEDLSALTALRQKEGRAEATEAQARQRRLDDLAVEGAELRAKLAGRTREAERIAFERQLDKEIEDTKDFAQAREKQLQKPIKLQIFDQETAKQEAQKAEENARVIDDARRALLQGEERRAADFAAITDREIEALRKRGASEEEVLAFQQDRRQKFFDDEARQREELIREIERESLPEPQRRTADFEDKIQKETQRLRDAGVEEGQILDLISKQRDKFQADEAKRNATADFEAQIVPLEDAFRRIQAAAASGSTAAQQVAKTAAAAQGQGPSAAAGANKRETEIQAQANDFAKASAAAEEEAVSLLEKINAGIETLTKKGPQTAVVA